MAYKYNQKLKRWEVTIWENGKRVFNATFSERIHGKYAESMAKYADNTRIRLNNYYEEEDDYLKIFTYHHTTDTYDEILISKEDYNLIKDIHWNSKKDEHGQELYAVGKITGNKEIKMHRLIMGVTDPNIKVDHIAGNGLDNRRSNLRRASSKLNSQNRTRVNSNSKTGIIGVHFSEKDQAYYATWSENGKAKHKHFSINAYGEDEALEMAIEYREKMIKENNYGKED